MKSHPNLKLYKDPFNNAKPLQLIGKRKLGRLTSLAKHSQVSICVDSIDNISELSEVAAGADVNIGCVVEVNVGQER